MTPPLAFFRAGDNGTVELVTVFDESVNGEPMRVMRSIELTPERAINLGYSAIGEGLQAKNRESSDAPAA